MLDHPVFGTAFGLILFFAVFSVLVSAVQEGISSVLKLRARDLWRGLVNLLGEQEATKAYEHPLVKSLAGAGAMPSYIDTRTLSTAVLDNASIEVLGKAFASTSNDDIAKLATEIPDDHPLKTLLQSMTKNSDDAASYLHKQLSDWFNEGMDRISGWYKRKSQIMVFVIASILTVAVNANTIDVVETLWANDNLRSTIAADTSMTLADFKDESGSYDPEMETIYRFPVGWSKNDLATIDRIIPFFSPESEGSPSEENPSPNGSSDGGKPEEISQWLPEHIVGWALTVIGVSLGAPFWFDLIGRISNLRGTGPKKTEPSGHRA